MILTLLFWNNFFEIYVVSLTFFVTQFWQAIEHLFFLLIETSNQSTERHFSIVVDLFGEIEW